VSICPATRLLYHRLDERVFAHISRLRAAHNIPSSIPGALAPSLTAGVHLNQASQAAFYQAAAASVVAHQQQHPMFYGHPHAGSAPSRMLPPFHHLPPSQLVTQVPLPLPKPSKSPFPVEQLAVLEDAFRRSRTISRDDAHSLAQRLCACVNSTTGARLPAMTELQVKVSVTTPTRLRPHPPSSMLTMRYACVFSPSELVQQPPQGAQQGCPGGRY
jgi:hypothetical protein